MKSYPNLRRWLAVATTLVVFGGVLVLARLAWATVAGHVGRGPGGGGEERSMARIWPLFGGTIHRNMVNPVETNMPTEWDVEKGKNIKWVAELGSKAYGGPVIAGGKIFIGTNNAAPRDPAGHGRQGHPHVLPRGGRQVPLAGGPRQAARRAGSTTGPTRASAPRPVVEGNRLYYVSNRCEVVCADTERAGCRQERGRPGREIQGPDRRRHHLAAGHDEGAGRLPAQPGRLLAADRRRHCCSSSPATAWTRATSTSRRPRRRASWPWTRRPARCCWRDNVARREDHARPVVQPGLRRGQRQAADHLPRRRRLDARLRARDTAS